MWWGGTDLVGESWRSLWGIWEVPWAGQGSTWGDTVEGLGGEGLRFTFLRWTISQPLVLGAPAPFADTSSVATCFVLGTQSTDRFASERSTTGLSTWGPNRWKIESLFLGAGARLGVCWLLGIIGGKDLVHVEVMWPRVLQCLQKRGRVSYTTCWWSKLPLGRVTLIE